jgi:hypothetical protein
MKEIRYLVASLVLFGIVLLLAVLPALVQNTKNKLTKTPESPFAFEPTEIKLSNSQRVLSFIKVDSSWSVAEGDVKSDSEKKKADAEKITSFLTALKGTQLITIVSQNESNISSYALDNEQKYSLSLKNSDRSFEIYVGIPESSSSVFMRYPDKNEVYGITGTSLAQYFKNTKDDWRDKTVISRQSKDIPSIEVKGDITLELNGDYLHPDGTTNRTEISRDISDRARNAFAVLTGTRFATPEEAKKLKKTNTIVLGSISTSDFDTLYYTKNGEGSYEYIIQNEKSDEVFIVPSYQLDPLFSLNQ